jgi:hypothetical protein
MRTETVTSGRQGQPWGISAATASASSLGAPGAAGLAIQARPRCLPGGRVTASASVAVGPPPEEPRRASGLGLRFPGGSPGLGIPFQGGSRLESHAWAAGPQRTSGGGTCGLAMGCGVGADRAHVAIGTGAGVTLLRPLTDDSTPLNGARRRPWSIACSASAVANPRAALPDSCLAVGRHRRRPDRCRRPPGSHGHGGGSGGGR